MFHVYLCYEGRFYVRRVVNLIKTAKVNAYIRYKFGKMELLSIHANTNYFKTHYFNAFQEANTYIYRALEIWQKCDIYGLSL